MGVAATLPELSEWTLSFFAMNIRSGLISSSVIHRTVQLLFRLQSR